MNVIRPIKQTDYQALHDIAVESGIGFTSLPVNEELLQRKITRAEHAFNKKVLLHLVTNRTFCYGRQRHSRSGWHYRH